MLRNLSQLLRYRGLIVSLVARELKARYRGSVLGFFWSFVNPLLLLSIYTFVFTVILPNQTKVAQPYALFMFCGILPWNWFSSSLLEASNALVSGGNLIKKVLFPAEILPLVSVLANMVHFFLGLTILAAFIIGYRHWPDLPGTGSGSSPSAPGRCRSCSPRTGSSTGCATRLPRPCDAVNAAINAIALANVTKIYRRYSGRQFATLKSALLQRSILRDLAP